MIEDFDPDAPSHDALWDRARADYAAGESASTVCERYRLTRSTFFARARAEGWRRSDGEGRAAPDPYVAEMEAALVFEFMSRPAATPAYVLARRAWAMAEVALLQRRRVEAASWIRIARDLRKLVMAETGALTWRRAEQLGEEAKAQVRPEPQGLSAFEEPGPEDDQPPESDTGDDAAPTPSRDETGEEGGTDGCEPLAAETAAPFREPGFAPLPRPASAPSPEPDWGPLPLAVIASPKKLDAFLHGEFAEAWTAHLDSPDQSDRTADDDAPALPTSPAQAGGQLEAGAERGVRSPNLSTARTWAPACAGEEER